MTGPPGGDTGWTSQHASLVSISADAYLNEMGITSRLLLEENPSMGRPVTDWDTVADPEDDGADLEIFARFMRATKAPSRNEALAATADAQPGAQPFDSVGCATCHVSVTVTAPVGTVLNGGAFIVPEALGDKIIHPYSDFRGGARPPARCGRRLSGTSVRGRASCTTAPP